MTTKTKTLKLTLSEMTVAIEALAFVRAALVSPDPAAQALIEKLMETRGCERCGSLDWVEGPFAADKGAMALCSDCADALEEEEG